MSVLAFMAAGLLAAQTPVCLFDGADVAGVLQWRSVQQSDGVSKPQAFLGLDLSVCLDTPNGVYRSNLLRIQPKDETSLNRFKDGDVLIVTARYRLPAEVSTLHDIVAYDARLER